MDDLLQNLANWKAAVVLGWIALFFLLERLWPAATPPAAAASEARGGRYRLGRNGGLWLCTVALSASVVLPISAWASSQPLIPRSGIWAGWPGLLLDIVLLDLWIYWWHRANHEVPFLWRFHEVHHLDRFLDTTSALRFHFGEVLISALVRAAVIVLLGIPLLSVLVFEVLVLCSAIFHHSNLRLPPRVERALSKVIITPSIHWVHHHARRADTDSNYGTIFSFWDRLFASRSRTPRRLDMEIGVEGRDEQPLPALLLRPFRRRAAAQSPVVGE